MQNTLTQAIEAKFAILRPLLDERARRLWAAVEARAIGRGGIIRVAEATGLSRATIRAGLQELAGPDTPTGRQAPTERLRRPGGGQKPLGTRDPHLVRALKTLVDPVTRGDPMVSREVVVNLIGHTTTQTGLAIRSELDENSYPTGREVTTQQMESLSIKRDKFHGEWNYTIRART